MVDDHTTVDSHASDARRDSPLMAAIETTLIVLVFFLLAGTLPPNVNEAHYLAKAKHYWNTQWCAGDHFLESADAHLVFYWSFGWLTRFASLTSVAWVGRFLTWTLLAWAWQRLSRVVVPGRFYSVLSASLFATLVDRGHMAGEWIIGGVEAKGFAYVLLILAIEALARDRWRLAIILSGASAAFHVLVGGWGLVAIGLAWLLSAPGQRPSISSLLSSGLLAVLLSLPGLVPGLTLTWSVDPATIRESNRIYVFERLSHHLVFHDLPHIFIARHATLMVLFLAGWVWMRRTGCAAFSGPLPRFVMGSMLIAILGAVLDQLLLYFPAMSAAILRYYWFRMSDVITPLGVTFACIALQQRVASTRSNFAFWTLLPIIVIVAAHVGWAVFEHRKDPRPSAVIQAFPGDHLPAAERIRHWREWQSVCQWIDANTEPSDIFLTPRNQQTFKWYANRAEVVTGKDVPQDAVGIVAWRRRMVDVFPYTVRYCDLVAHGESRLRELSKKYKFRYIVVDRGVSSGRLTFPRVYPEPQSQRAVFEVYQMPNDN